MNEDKARHIEASFYKQKVFIDVLKGLSRSASNLPEQFRLTLSKKISDVDLLLHKYLHQLCDSDPRSINIFGLESVPTEEFSFNEQKLLQSEVEKHILDTFPKLLQTYDEILQGSAGTGHPGKAPVVLSEERGALASLTQSYGKLLAEGVRRQAELCELLQEWLEVRSRVILQQAETYVDLMDIKNRLLELKAKIIEVQLLLTAYTHNDSVMAYMEIHEDITKKMDRLHREVTVYRKLIEEDL